MVVVVYLYVLIYDIVSQRPSLLWGQVAFTSTWVLQAEADTGLITIPYWIFHGHCDDRHPLLSVLLVFSPEGAEYSIMSGGQRATARGPPSLLLVGRGACRQWREC